MKSIYNRIIVCEQNRNELYIRRGNEERDEERESGIDSQELKNKLLLLFVINKYMNFKHDL